MSTAEFPLGRTITQPGGRLFDVMLMKSPVPGCSVI